VLGARKNRMDSHRTYFTDPRAHLLLIRRRLPVTKCSPWTLAVTVLMWLWMISSYDVRVNQSSWSTRRTPRALGPRTRRYEEKPRGDAELNAAVVSGWNACAGGFNRGRGRGRGDSIVALQLGLVRVSRLAAQSRYAPFVARSTLSFSSLAAARLVVGFATEGEPLFRLEDLAENFLSADLVSIIRSASWRSGKRVCHLRVRQCLLWEFSLGETSRLSRGESARLCDNCPYLRPRNSRFSQRTITEKLPNRCRDRLT